LAHELAHRLIDTDCLNDRDDRDEEPSVAWVCCGRQETPVWPKSSLKLTRYARPPRTLGRRKHSRAKGLLPRMYAMRTMYA